MRWQRWMGPGQGMCAELRTALGGGGSSRRGEHSSRSHTPASEWAKGRGRRRRRRGGGVAASVDSGGVTGRRR